MWRDCNLLSPRDYGIYVFSTTTCSGASAIKFARAHVSFRATSQARFQSARPGVRDRHMSRVQGCVPYVSALRVRAARATQRAARARCSAASVHHNSHNGHASEHPTPSSVLPPLPGPLTPTHSTPKEEQHHINASA
eukprot:gene3529-biopygen6735